METDLYVLSIDTLFKNPSNIPINPLNIKNAPPATNDSQGYNSGVLNIVNPNNINDDKNEFPKAYYPANAGNYIHFLSEPIKNVTSVRLSSVEFPNVSFIFSQAKGSNYFTLVIPKDKLSVNDPVENPYDSSEEDNIQFNTDNTNAEPYRITIVIPDGIYSYVTLIDQIQSTFDNINNGQYAGGSQNAPGGQGNNNQINNASYPNATLNFNFEQDFSSNSIGLFWSGNSEWGTDQGNVEASEAGLTDQLLGTESSVNHELYWTNTYILD